MLFHDSNKQIVILIGIGMVIHHRFRLNVDLDCFQLGHQKIQLPDYEPYDMNASSRTAQYTTHRFGVLYMLE